MTVICQLVRQLGLKDDVLFLGKQDSVEELYAISDLKLLLSEKESFGLVLLEAMACGVPCIGTQYRGDSRGDQKRSIRLLGRCRRY